MEVYTEDDILKCLKVVKSTIANCEKMQPKFAEGTSQHTLLKNRIKALYISKALLKGEVITYDYSKIELEDAVAPVSSIINKCEKAKLNAIEGTATHTRLKNIINAMTVSNSLILYEIERMN